MEVLVNAVELDNDIRYVSFLATAVWPKSVEPPSDLNQAPTPKLSAHLLEQMNKWKDPSSIVFGAIHGINNPKVKPASAKVWEIFDAAFGLLEVKLTNIGEYR